MKRRTWTSIVVTLFLTLLSSAAWGGSYLNRAAILLEGSRAEREFVAPRSNDRELVEMVHAAAEARRDAAHAIRVPKSITEAHPHLLLVLENCERAYAYALEGNHQKFVEYIERARGEDRAFRAVVSALGYSLPPVPRP